MFYLRPLVNGIIVDGIYCLITIGYSLQWGVMNLLNVSHGALIMLGAYFTYYVFTLIGIDPFISLPFSAFCCLFGCVGITEPEAGTDAAAMKSTAVKKDNFYILKGQKTWITWGSVANICICYAHTDSSKKHKGISALIFFRKANG